jgi:hypothetical protein
LASWTKSPIIMHKISAHGVHLAVTDVLYSKPEAEPTEDVAESTEDVAESTEDVAEPLPEDNEGADEEEEGFVLDRNVPDAVLPDMSEDFRRIIQKVRNVAKFFRDLTEYRLQLIIKFTI